MAAGAGTVTIRIVGDAKSALASFGEVGAGADGLGGKLSGIGKAALATGAIVATAVVAVGAELYKIGESFDEQYDKIRVGTGATGKDLDVLKDEFRKVVADVPTDFGKAGDAVTTVQQKLGLAGDKAAGIAEQFLELSRITKTDLATNLQAGTDALNNWGTVTADQPRLLDEMFRATQLTGITFGDLASQMTDTGLVLRGLGFSVEQSVGILAMLKTGGLDSGDAMTALSKTLAVAAKEGKNAGDLFRETFDAIKSGAPGAEQAAIKLFGAKGGGKFIELIKEGKFDYQDLMGTIQSGTDTIIGAGKDTQDFSEKWLLFKNRVLLALEPVAMRVFDGMGKLMDKLPGIAAKVTEKFDEIRPVLQQVADVISAVVTPIIKYLADHTDELKLILTGLAIVVGVVLVAGLAILAAGLAVIVIGVGLVIAAAVALIDVFQWLWDKTEGVRQILGDAASVATGVVVGAFDAVSAAVSTVTGWLQALWDKSEGLRAFFADAFSAAMNALMVPFDQLRAAVDWLWSSIDRVISAAQTAIDWVGKIPGVGSGAGSISNLVKNDPRLSGARASGGPVMSGLSYLVGERGPEILTMGSGSGNVSPNSAMGGNSHSIQVIVQGRATREDGQAVVDALERWVKSNGPIPALLTR